ncbi:S41 family peptidase [Brumimicrobium aurantiacum]|uniref:S41 family peptidase n=1 Tax=Brumimicrobium aurantiacum TaxID=1737063 RepID=A0A3E1F1Y9_9FLAO|nr:S41 family peptidase [Brumimicrobium aurantiacum]RFC55826.1 S41 family peptidase [Brumimicrobium aurantiacum]
MNNSNKAIYPLIGSLLIAIGLLLGVSLGKGKTSGSSIEGKYEQKLTDIIQVLDREYVDSIDKKELFEKTITDLLHGLDPHSNYIAAEDLAALSEGIQGKFGGVGIRFTIYDDTLSVVNVIDQSPAYRTGVQKFDQIINVDGEDIANVGLSNEHVRELLKGEEGTPVKVTLLRKGQKIEKEIIRGAVPIESVMASYMLTDDIGYIRLSQFSMQSANEFLTAAVKLKSQGMKDLVLDLRFNGGGVLGSAVAILDAILDKGTPIVSTKGKNSPEQTLFAENDPFLGDANIAVLINSSSASASEIVAGAIQDNDRGTIIGRRSFGKGLVQQDIQLKDGSNLRLTVSRYYTPTGRSIQKPYTEDYDEYLMDEINRYENGELYEVDSSLLVDSLKYTTPKGKVVYGGGGIMPDVFVPLDTAGNSTFFRRLQYANVFNEFSYHYARFHNLNKFNTVQEFDHEFKVTEKLLKDFFEYAEEKHDITYNEKEFNQSSQRIKTSIKAEIARQRWLELGAYYIFNQNEEEIKEAIEVLQ